MATDTGKIFTAFQIIHRLSKSPWRNDPASTKPKRILFLADRNILIDQTMVNDFRPCKGAMAKLSPNAKGIEKVDSQDKLIIEEVGLAINKSNKQVNKSYEIYLSLYQAVTVKHPMSTKILSETMTLYCRRFARYESLSQSAQEPEFLTGQPFSLIDVNKRVIELSLSPEGHSCESCEQEYKLRVPEGQVYTSVNDGTASPV